MDNESQYCKEGKLHKSAISPFNALSSCYTIFVNAKPSLGNIFHWLPLALFLAYILEQRWGSHGTPILVGLQLASTLHPPVILARTDGTCNLNVLMGVAV